MSPEHGPEPSRVGAAPQVVRKWWFSFIASAFEVVLPLTVERCVQPLLRRRIRKGAVAQFLERHTLPVGARVSYLDRTVTGECLNAMRSRRDRAIKTMSRMTVSSCGMAYQWHTMCPPSRWCACNMCDAHCWVSDRRLGTKGSRLDRRLQHCRGVGTVPSCACSLTRSVSAQWMRRAA